MLLVVTGERGWYIVIGMVFLGGTREGGEGVWRWGFGFRGRGLEGLEVAVGLGWSGGASLVARARRCLESEASGSKSGISSSSSSIGDTSF